MSDRDSLTRVPFGQWLERGSGTSDVGANSRDKSWQGQVSGVIPIRGKATRRWDASGCEKSYITSWRSVFKSAGSMKEIVYEVKTPTVKFGKVHIIPLNV